jgi:hypothetical protein
MEKINILTSMQKVLNCGLIPKKLCFKNKYLYRFKLFKIVPTSSHGTN